MADELFPERVPPEQAEVPYPDPMPQPEGWPEDEGSAPIRDDAVHPSEATIPYPDEEAS